MDIKKEEEQKTVDIGELRERLKGTSGKQYWRSLEELSETKDFQDWVHNEFPQEPTMWDRSTTRRTTQKKQILQM